MARSADTYRGARRNAWKAETGPAQHPQPWSEFKIETKPRSKTTLAKDAARAEKADLDFKNWVTALGAKLSKRFVLSAREVSAFLVQQ